jgi:hypothetical protein
MIFRRVDLAPIDGLHNPQVEIRRIHIQPFDGQLLPDGTDSHQLTSVLIGSLKALTNRES